jgi:hypothetical protein
MPRAKLITILAAALLLTQVQCVTACVSQVNQPPCHKHHDCSDRTQAAAVTAAPAIPMLATVGPVAAIAHVLPGPLSPAPESPLSPSPPGLNGQSTIVLRI